MPYIQEYLSLLAEPLWLSWFMCQTIRNQCSMSRVQTGRIHSEICCFTKPAFTAFSVWFSNSRCQFCHFCQSLFDVDRKARKIIFPIKSNIAALRAIHIAKVCGKTFFDQQYETTHDNKKNYCFIHTIIGFRNFELE